MPVQHFCKTISNLFSFENEPDLFLYRSCSSHNIFFHCFLKQRKPVSRIMELFYRLMQCLRRIVRQQTLEIPECHRTFIKLLRLLYQIIGTCIGNKFIRSPVISRRIYVIWFSINRRDHIQCLTFRISAIFYNLLFQK